MTNRTTLVNRQEHLDVNKHRDLLIKHNNIQNANEIYTFYYDETNNIRRLHLTSAGLNVKRADNFVLAGVLHKGVHHDADLAELFDILTLQKTTKELKLKHVATGTFLEMLNSRKLCVILKWLLENDYFIHYFNLNLVYWSIVDIVDSIVGELRHPYYIMAHKQLKSDLYDIAIENKEVFLAALRFFDYPDVHRDRLNDFSQWLISFVNENNTMLPVFRAKTLGDLVDEASKLDDLPFVSGYHGSELISSFMVFYLHNLYLFKNSKHVFDEEHSVETALETVLLTEGEKPIVNYTFVRSLDDKAIQVSDVIAGFLGKYFTYLKDVTIEKLKADKEQLNTRQSETLLALRQLVDISDNQCRGFFHKATSDSEQFKNDWFLHDVEFM